MEQKMEQKLNNKRKLVDALKWVYTHNESKKGNNRHGGVGEQADVTVAQEIIAEERSGIQIAVLIYGDIPKVISKFDF
jgi:hypothetical protein